jgi:ATP-dependent helicase Lhr and Lhr-like helicase
MERITRKRSKREVMGLMEPLVSDWFGRRFEGLTEPQAYAIPLIHERRSVLVSSPTGTGKTLTAFLSIINELFKYAKEGRLEDRIYAVYVSPLKALANDINRNLEEPLREMRELSEAREEGFPQIRVGVRSGDTSSYERQRMLRKPPHIFITTPESLALVLAAPKFRERFSRVEWVIVDEIHEVCDSKRGVHLSLTLERLQDLCESPFVRVGLSATLAPMEEIASFLSGYQDGGPREICLVEAKTRKDLDLSVICPAEDMTALPFEIVNARMYDTLKEMVDAHTTTLVFTNTRSGTESVVYKLKERGLEKIEAHHGSLSKETRLGVEERLKRGDLKCVVSSTSLELGIDIGSIDLVCQIGSPKSVAKGLQRVGRSGHGHGQTAKGRMLVMDNDDLVECAVLSRAAHRGQVDRVSIPENCLDVLAQSIVGMSVERRWGVEEAFRLVRGSYCFRNLSRESFMDVLRYLGARDEFEGVYSKIWFDPEEGRFGRKRGSRMIYSMNVGTIPEEANYRVFTEKGGMVGDLSEKFAERLSPGDVFVLGGRSYEFRRIKGMRAFVREAQGKKPTVPSWTGEMLPRSFDLSMEIARFRREMALRLEGGEEEGIIDWLREEFAVDHGSAQTILSYFREQISSCDLIPNDQSLAVEGYIDMGGRYSVIFHFPFGRRVNDALSRAYAFQITKRLGCNVSVSITDDAFMITSPRRVDLDGVKGMLSSSDLEGVLRKAVKDSELFKQRFRHTAARSFMILRAYKGRQVSVNRQQVRSSFLLDSLGEMGRFPVIEETYRELLMDVMDIDNARGVLIAIEEGEREVLVIDYSSTPTPFAHGVVLAGISDLVLMEDRSALLRELHRKVLSKVMAQDLKEFEFEEERVSQYFQDKAVLARTQEEIPGLLSRTGPLRIFKERGRTLYPYVARERSTVDEWALRLLRSGEIASVYLDDFYFVNAVDLPLYASIFRKERTIGGLEHRVLECLDQGRSAKELADLTGSSVDRVGAVLRKLESTFQIGRCDLDGRRWLYCRREVTPFPREGALDTAIERLLSSFGPAGMDEIAYALNLGEDEVRRALEDMVREGILVEGWFLVSEQPQFLTERDYLRLKSGSLTAIDHQSVAEYRRSKQAGPFGDIMECLRFFGEMGMPFDVYSRVENFTLEGWERLRQEGIVLSGRFLRGRVRYVLSKDAPMFVEAYRRDGLSANDRMLLDLIDRHGGLTLRALAALTELTKGQLKESLDRLDRNLYVVRGYESGESWSSENVYMKFDPPAYGGDAVRDIVERFVRAHGPVPFRAIRQYTRFGKREILDALSSLDLERISVGRENTEMYLMAEEFEALERTVAAPDRVRVCSLYDPIVQPLWAQISSRYGDRWIFPLIQGSRVVGALEKWNMSGLVEVRQLDLEEGSLLPQVVEALEEVIRYHSMAGLDVLRLTEVMGTAVPDLASDVRRVFEERGYMSVGEYLAKGNLVPHVFSWERILANVFRRQGLAPDTVYENVLDAIKITRGFRSDAEASLRCQVAVPLKKLQEQRLLERVNIIPGYVTYTDLKSASLLAKAKSHPLTEDMVNLLKILRDKGSLNKEEMYTLSLVGKKGTYEALLALQKSGNVYTDHRGRLRPVPESDLDVHEARKEVIRGLFRNFGVFSAEDLQRFVLNEISMREMRVILSELEKEGLLVKGFLREGSQSLHWMLGEDLSSMDESFGESFVLTPEDNLYLYLKPWIKETRPSMSSVIFRGTEVVGAFSYRKRGKDIIITEFEGDREARALLNKHVKRLGLTIRGEETGGIPDWEIQEFYEKVHPGV